MTGRAAPTPREIEAENDRLAREHPIDDYYERSSLPIRLVERRRFEIIRNMVGDAAGLRILEVGVGGGHVLGMFPRAELTAVDVSEEFLRTARKNLADCDVRFLKGDVTELGLPAAHYHRIICTEVLEHTRNPDAILREIAHLLRPDGVAVLTVPNDPLILRLKGLIRRVPLAPRLLGRVEWGGDAFHLHRWTPHAFRRQVARHFRVSEYRASPSRALPIRACFRCVAHER